MLFRASNAVGYTAYPDNAVRRFVEVAAQEGIDIFRIFDSLNWLPNMKVAMETVRRTSRICEAAVCYTGDIDDPKRDKYPLAYYVRMAKELEKMGAHVLAIKDMAGLLKPYAAYRLVKALREEIGLPVHFHTHDTSGIAAASILKAAEAGVDVVDGALSSMSGSTSQPNLNSVVAALAHDRNRGAGLDFDALNRASDYWEIVRANYAPFDSAPRSGTADVYLHEMPGGQYTNLREQAESLGLGPRWPEIARMYADVNHAFGDIVKVTPSSKVVGDMALFLIQHGMTVTEFCQLPADHSLNIPNSVVEMFEGTLGEPEGGWPKNIARVILKGRKPGKGRPGAKLKPVQWDETRALLEKKTGHKPSETDLTSYVMYPDVFLKFDRARREYGDLSVVPSPVFFYGMKNGEEMTVELEAGKTLVIKFLTISEPHPDGHRTVFFELNGQPREVVIRDKRIKAETRVHPKADPEKPEQVGAPIPGAVTAIAVELNQPVAKGDKLLVLEAMKMQTTVYAPVSGRVAERHVQVGQTVEPKDLLITIG
jgi:pyruvate carboxylase